VFIVVVGVIALFMGVRMGLKRCCEFHGDDIVVVDVDALTRLLVLNVAREVIERHCFKEFVVVDGYEDVALFKLTFTDEIFFVY
jgi:hypothetical protein